MQEEKHRVQEETAYISLSMVTEVGLVQHFRPCKALGQAHFNWLFFIMEDFFLHPHAFLLRHMRCLKGKINLGHP